VTPPLNIAGKDKDKDKKKNGMEKKDNNKEVWG